MKLETINKIHVETKNTTKRVLRVSLVRKSFSITHKSVLIFENIDTYLTSFEWVSFFIKPPQIRMTKLIMIIILD